MPRASATLSATDGAGEASGPMEEPAPPVGRLPAITGLRIFAALAVYCHHLGPPAGAPTLVASAMWAGWCGVTIFFVLSGFVLTINYFDSLRRPTPAAVGSFLVARFARVYPLYILTLAYFVARMAEAGTSLDGLGGQILMFGAWYPAGYVGFNNVSWSVSVEAFLYLAFPLLAVIVGRVDRGSRHLWLLAAAIVLIVSANAFQYVRAGLEAYPATNPNSALRWLYFLPLARLGDFGLGIVAARLYLHLRGVPRWERVGGPMVLAGLAAMLVVATRQEWGRSAFALDIAYAAPTFVVLLGLALAPRHSIARFLSLPWVVLLGEASYAFYLVHYEGIRLLDSQGWTHAITWATLAMQIFNLLIILALSLALHLFVERTARSWIRARFTRGGAVARTRSQAHHPAA